MKILYLRTIYFFGPAGGMVGHTAGVINSLYKKAKLHVISNAQLPGVHIKTEVIKPVRYKFLFKFINEFLYNLKIIKKLKGRVNEFNYIYHRHSEASFSGAWLAQKYKIPLILEFNSSEVWKIKNWKGQSKQNTSVKKTLTNFLKKYILLPAVARIEQYNLNQASYIVVVSVALKENLIKLGIPTEKIIFYPNGIDLEKFNPQISGNAIRKHHKLEQKTIVAGFIGTFGEWHGAIELAKAIILFFNHPHKEKVKFLLIGSGKLFDKVFQMIKDSGNLENVIFTGVIPQNKAPEYLAACDILLSPHIPNSDGTSFFGSPTKLFEYMAMGKAIVASDLDQIGQILEHEVDALLIQPGDPTKIVDSINLLIRKNELRRKLGNNAFEKVKLNYTWDSHTQKIFDSINFSEKC
ncbi:glycosyltransferase family 4 protein [Maribellus maritimus]|uniref:glycosyltransferase family 4 protein n=1 Tax=Maribellus maritimus TaxID=2870838 RepID=UPI001EEC3D8A|nr:glycosyltransferase family 4 protein [Maribellus maritimus]MCG6188149.1 glycosyltransferase family 4 protein [Maribellus maritimus]